MELFTAFDQQIIDAVKEIHQSLAGRCIFVGSFGLRLNNRLDRVIHDLDVITEDSVYGTSQADEVGREGSGIFTVDGHKVWCVHAVTSNGIKVDYMWRADRTEFDLVDFHGTEIKVQKPEYAISAKESYLSSNQRVNRTKHEADLREMNEDNDIAPMSDDLPF